ncbi:MAG: (2Fe-2S) ferredoxin domain-containing protein [Alphaproteobacteria bacterium]|nr:(2Fe-2S) ferredoxin domain-containing protein [Alphaproteobacteria bacterium]
MSTPYFHLHVFCCTNERPDKHPRGSCAGRGGVKLRNYMKVRAKELAIPGVRINSAGCLDRCELGPVVVIYPQGIWYRMDSFEDVDEILAEHLQNGRIVERLRLTDGGVDNG